MDRVLMIYPFGKETTPFLRYLSLTNFNKIIPMVPTGFGTVNQDINTVDCGYETGFIIRDDFYNGLNECDTILFTYENISISPEKYINLIQKSISMMKEVYVTKSLQQWIGNDFNQYLEKITILGKNKINFHNGYQTEILSQKIPVILITGLGDYCNKFELQLSLREKFLNNGYNVAQLGSKDYSELFGFEVLPDFLFEESNLSKKIIAFNHYIYRLLEKKKYDVLIIGIAGGLLPINNQTTQYFGELPFIISNAIIPDITICSLFNQKYTKENLEKFQLLLKYRYNSVTNFFHISNTKTIYTSGINRQVEYLSLEIKDDSQSEIDIYRLYNVFIKEDMESMYNDIFTTLIDNVEIL